MCVMELVVLYYLQKHVGDVYERSGRNPTSIRVLFVGCLLAAYFAGAVLGVLASDNLLGGYACAFLGVVAVTVVFYALAHNVPDAKKEPGYMDYYHEYRTTGEVTLARPRRKRRDPEDEEDDGPPPRPREPDRPYRRSSDPDDDRVREEDPPRRQRRRREDEEY